MNLIPGELQGNRVVAMSGKLQLPASVTGRKEDGAVTIGIRSEDVRVGPEEAAEAKVHDVENHGVEKIVTLRVDGQLFKATVPATLDLTIDGNVRFSFNPRKLKCFDRASGVSLDHIGWYSYKQRAGLSLDLFPAPRLRRSQDRIGDQVSCKSLPEGRRGRLRRR